MIIVINGRVFPTHPNALKGKCTANFLFKLFNMKGSEKSPVRPGLEVVKND